MGAPARWQLQDAKQRFSEVIRAAEQGEPQIVTRHGQDVAVVIDMEEYRRFKGERQDFKDFLVSEPRWDFDLMDYIGERDKTPPREIDFSD
jgi:prevent-host-death family protein